MPVYNAAKYLREAIDSILAQTFGDFEFIVVNDASTDESRDIIGSYRDPRIIVIDNPPVISHVFSCTKSLNIGINAARGEYIARMDADDISSPERFAKQAAFLDEHPDTGVIGTGIFQMNEEGRIIRESKRPTEHYLIKWKCFFGSAIFHPTVMARAEILKNNPYDETFTNAQDAELWGRLIFEKGIRFFNLPEPLLKYRVYSKSVSGRRSEEQILKSVQADIKNIKRSTYLSTEEEAALIRLRQGCAGLWQILRIYGVYKRLSGAYIKSEDLSYEQSKNIIISTRNGFKTNIKGLIKNLFNFR